MEILKKRHDILSLIKATSEEQGIQDYTITNVSKNQAGEGLLSEFFTATIKDNVSGKQLDFAIKVAFAEDKVRKTVPIRRFFENEVNFYSKVHPMLQKFERDRGISDNLQLIPKCFNVCIEDCSEMLILENLKVLKFECFDKTSFLDHEHISLIFKTYGRFHAYSFALRDQQPEEYQQLVGRLHNVYEECLNNESSTFQDYVRQNVQLIRQYLIPGEDDEVINKFRKYENNGINDILLDIVTEKCDYSAILHGDCWSNNMMFKYEVSLDKRQDILTFLKTISQEQGMQDYTITNVSTNEKGDGFQAEFFMVTIKDTASDKHLDIALKTAFIIDNIRNILPIRLAFENEIYFYSEVYPLFKKFERNHEISEDIKYVPKCFKVSLEDHSEMLALEDLKVSGFETFDRMSFLDHDHISFIFETYGRFHAYSFALCDQQPEEYKKLVGGFVNVYEKFLNDKTDFYKQLLRTNVATIMNYLIPGEDDEIINKFHKYENDGVCRIFEEVVTENCEYSAILHGDCWSNNIMFKYDVKNGKKLVDVRLIDWQGIKVGSPVCDLAYCLYSGTCKDIFDNLDEYLKIYHKSFSSSLKKLGSDPEKLFPFEAFKEQWKKFAKFGMCMAFGILKVKMTHTNDCLDSMDGLDTDNIIAEMKKLKFNEDEFKKMIRELLRHLCEIDAL
ncbi:EcKinase, DUF1679, and/or APH domain containing protein [Asbolus verrucosus]|uniref:EcKinase, DUF1679, and/or APH domain containing protein n=1 Tax=Asbolus verrucosus TaxID=1661398 RepID=A0A482V6B0_ASBVE|nr:EcKinase, DUF1679, and/or APH domain containing protein [Asbolus verrucosus]